MGKGIRAIAVSAMIAVVLAGVGCGSGDDDSLSKAEFIEQGNAICKAGEKASDAGVAAFIKAEAKKLPGKKTLNRKGEERMIAEGAVPPLEEMVRELSELDVPDGEEKTVNAIIAKFEDGVAEVSKDTSIAFTGDPFGEAIEAAEKYGLTSCHV